MLLTSLPLTNVYDTSSTSNHLSPTSSVTYNAGTAPEGWCDATTNTVTCTDQSRLRTDNTANRVAYTTTQTMSTNVNLYSYGNYYNWYSATAGHGIYNRPYGATEGDICPNGWRLTAGHGASEISLLNNSLGGYKNASNVAQYMNDSTTPTGAVMSKRLRHFPTNLLYSGYVSGNYLGNRGSVGNYWTTSSFSDSYYASFLRFDSSAIHPATHSTGKTQGQSVRCLVSGT